MRALQEEFDRETERDRRQVEELRGLIKCEEAEGGNLAVEKGIEKLLKRTKDEGVLDVASTLLKDEHETRAKVEQQAREQERFQEQAQLEMKDFDGEVEQIKASAKQVLNQALSRRDELRRQLEGAEEGGDERARLMQELGALDG